MAKRTRRSYDTEFKRNAVHLSQEEGRTVTDVAESLGISADLLYRWRQESDAHGKREELRLNGCIQSMSRKGNCWDNAVAESFFHTLKNQLIHRVKFQNVERAELALFQYIEAYYNRRRRHSTNGWLSPATFEEHTIYGKTA